MRTSLALTLTVFVSCTAINQQNAFLDSLPRPSNVVFNDDFESGLAKWNIGSGSWITSSPGSGGLALQSPSSTGIATFSIATAAMIDLSGKTACFLEYDARYLIKGVSGVSANVLFGSTTVGTLKESSALTDISSATAFVHKKAILPANGNGRISFVTNVTNDTTGYADLRIDNVTVICNGTATTTVTLVDENLDSSASNWSLQSFWAWSAGVGMSGSTGLQSPTQAGTYTGVGFATYTPSIDLTNRFSCLLEFYYAISNSANVNCISMDMNGIRAWASCDAPTNSGSVKTYLTAFEGTSANSLQFRCLDAHGANGWGVQCTADQVKLSCQQ